MSSVTSLDNIQSVFLEQIRARIPENIAFADELAELLNISRDSAYRRIRGETVLSLDEVKKLHDRYGVSVDAILSPSSNMALFHHRAITTDYTLSRWLNSVVKNLELVNSFKQKEMIFSAKDMPIFHIFRIPELASFKMFFWLKSVIKDPVYTHELYRPGLVPMDLLQAGSKAWKLYSTVPSTEIWSDEAFNDTLKQIEFCHECGFFAKHDDAAELYNQMIRVNSLIQEEASQGKKTDGSTFKLYENEILIADNTVFARMDNKRVVYINYNLINLLTTLQESFCEKTEIYLNNLIKNSTLISATAEKERNKFFNKMKERIEVYRKRLG